MRGSWAGAAGLTIGSLILFGGCTDNGDPTDSETGTESGTDTGTTAPAAGLERIDLVSDESGKAVSVDPLLINPWGLAYGPNTYFWVANEGSGTSTLYDGDGNLQSDAIGGPVQVADAGGKPAHPTGLAYNPTNGFDITFGEQTGASTFVFATEDGTIQGWSGEVNAENAVIAVQGADAAYLGAAIGDTLTRTALYVTNFAQGRVEAFDRDFQAADFVGAEGFTDAGIPEGYAPFGIAVIGDLVYVTWVAVAASGVEEETGAGLGYVDVFEMDGTLVGAVAEGGDLNAPWAVVRAPAEFGDFDGALLVGNFGDGTIAAYDGDTYEPMGLLLDEAGDPIAIEGLWGLAFGNGQLAGQEDELYYTAGPGGEQHGVFGVIRAPQSGGTETTPSER